MQEGETYLRLGNDNFNTGKYQTAIEYYQKAQECGDKRQKGEAYLGLGNAYLEIGQYQIVIDYCQKAQKVALECGDKRQEGEAYLRLGTANLNIGQYQTAIKHYQKAEKIALGRGDKRQEGEAYLWLGKANMKIDQYQTAIYHYEKARKVALERGDKRLECEAHLWLGNTYQRIGEYQTAIENYQQAKNLALESRDKRQECEAYLRLGNTYQKIHQNKKAVECYEKAQEIALEREDKRQEREAYLRIGYVHLLLDEFEKANECYGKAEKVALERGGKMQEEEEEAFLKLRNALSNRHQNVAVLWSKTSIKHRKKFETLVKIIEIEPTMATKIGQYIVCLEPEFVIGRGSDGTTVYVGLSDDGIEVAVKSLLLDRCKQLGANEKEILNSPMVRKEQHIVNYRFYTEEVDSVHAYLVLDLCEENLNDYVLSEERSKELLQSKGPTFVRQILHGLKALHCGNPVILHRDLKPSNIFVNVEGEMVLADFGISRKLTAGETTHNSGERGTEGWIAVESLPPEDDGDCLSMEESKVRYKKESDIQVVGMIIFYILTKGEHPYGGRSYIQTSNLVQGEPVKLNQLDDPLAKDLIDWMLRHDLRARPSVEECLQHPYLMSTDEKFHFVKRVGNEREIKTNDVSSDVVKHATEC